MKILLVDNYDSFTYNLKALFESGGARIDVMRNDQFEVEQTDAYDAIVLSPGPGVPSEAGKLMELIRYQLHKKPMLGICLGHQAIAEVCGGSLYNLSKVHHGVSGKVFVTEQKSSLFSNVPSSFQAGLYHSWAVNPELHESLELIAESENKVVLGIRHREYPVFGLQFHPESILTEHGKTIAGNFLKIAYEN